MLLPPLTAQDLAAFRLTSLEKDMKRDMLFEPDLGIPISALAVEQYYIPSGNPQLHPADAALLSTKMTSGAPSLKGDDADVSWLLRTKYITNELAAERVKKGERKLMADEREELGSDERLSLLQAIEASFETALKPPIHPTRPDLKPLEILPVLPDAGLHNRELVLTVFDSDPTLDAGDRIAQLSSEEHIQLGSSLQLKSFQHRRSDGTAEKFVALLVPTHPGELAGEYQWAREFDSQVRFDEKGSTFLLRYLGDHVAFHDLNTRVGLRKRKKVSAAADDENVFLQPEKVVVSVPGGDAVAPEEEEERQAGLPPSVPPQLRTETPEEGAARAAALRSAFGSDDDDI